MDSLPTPSFPYLSTAIHLAVRKVIGNGCVLVLSWEGILSCVNSFPIMKIPLTPDECKVGRFLEDKNHSNILFTGNPLVNGRLGNFLRN